MYLKMLLIHPLVLLCVQKLSSIYVEVQDGGGCVYIRLGTGLAYKNEHGQGVCERGEYFGSTVAAGDCARTHGDPGPHKHEGITTAF